MGGALHSATIMLLAGLMGGVLSSAPLGVINLWVTDSTLAGRSRSIWWFVAGVVATDMLYAAAAIWGYHYFLQDSITWPYLEVGGGALLIVLGLLSLRKKSRAPGAVDERGASFGRYPLRDFAFGAFLCASNPAFLMFWVFLVGEVESRITFEQTELGSYLFVLGCGIGDLGWFRFLTWLVNRGKETVAPKILRPARLVIAAVFVIAGGAALVKGVNDFLT